MHFDKSIYLLDGGMGQELIKRGVRGNEVLWSANALFSSPTVVQETHEAYIEAGADIITTNTYCTTRARFDRLNLDDRFVELNQLAGQLAQQAREERDRPDVLIAGSLPPYYGTYRPELVRSFAELVPIYQEQAEVLAPYVDLFLCETMSTAEEARAAATAAIMTGKPVWVAWTLQDDGSDKLRSGETLLEAVQALNELSIEAFLVNCCAPESITASMPQLVTLSSQPVGGYANGFVAIPDDWLIEDSVDELGSRTDLGPESYAEHVARWLSAGARIVGGCCEVGPTHIARLRVLIDSNS
ncbi:homocysteine S-methyltransferase family protein [Chloroflexi bacterium TSY]|nr:homocysteine S-methyltransferase family protein [Chloroflexi bacterium TSY]